MKRWTVLVVLVLTTAGCASRPDSIGAGSRSPSAEQPVTIPDSEIGLARGTAFEQPQQEPIPFNSVDPGDSSPRPRPNPEFPPVIPHATDDLPPVTIAENPCLDCHGADVAADFDAPAVPASHHVDLRRAPDSTAEQIVGARYVCVSCHVAQTETAPLVGNPAGP